MYLNPRKFTFFGETKKIINGENGQRQDGACPRITQKETKVLEICSSNAVVHPWTVVIHSTNAAIADPAMVGTTRFATKKVQQYVSSFPSRESCNNIIKIVTLRLR